MKVVGDLCKNTGPVDAVDCSEAQSLVDFLVSEQRFQNVLSMVSLSFLCRLYNLFYLTVVECTLNGQIVHIGVGNSRHLSLLNWANLALGVHDEHRHILLASETINGSGACIPTRCANNCQVLSVLALLVLISAHQKVFEQVAHELQCNILERERWAMEQFQKMHLLFMVKRNQGRNIGGAERGVGFVNNLLQVCSRNLLLRYVQGEDLIGELLKGVVPPFAQEVGGKFGNLLGNEKSAIVGQTFEDYLFEGELVCFSA